jgi:hypothetical protein
MSDDLDSVVDEARERIAYERESLAEFAHAEPTNNFCELCLMPADGGICVRCDPWDDGLYGENAWTYDEDVRNA